MDILDEENINQQLLKNKLLNTSNFLNYSGLTYEDIITAINSKISSDKRFDNFRESGIAQLILEIFSGSTDLTNYFIERTAEECFFDTAKLKSSLILLARNLAYDIKRSNPSQCRIKVILKGNFSSSIFSSGDIIQIPQYTNFNLEGTNFLLYNQFNYTLTENDLNKGDNYKKEILYNEVYSGEDQIIKLFQGERKIIKISGELNPNVNQIFQKYKISDKTFSNLYGERDLISPLTQIGIGSTLDEAFPSGLTEWEIDRRSLLRTDSIETYNFNSSINNTKKICLIRTSLDEGVEILFGDDKYVSKGLINSNQNIYIKYLSTLGASANKNGFIGKIPVINTSIILRDVDITNNISFELTSNVSLGSDLESNESIKINAPAIYYTLDRLVSKTDYITFLESLSSPIPIKNAIAWGEQEEIKLGQLYDNRTRSAIKKLFNVVLFSSIGSLYNIKSNLTEFSTKENLSEENVVLDSDFKEDEINSQSYFNIFTINDEDGGNVIEEIRNQTIISQGDNSINTYLIINGASTDYDFFDWQHYRLPYPVRIYYTSAENITAYDSEDVSYFEFLISTENVNNFDQICKQITESIKNYNILPNDFICYWDSINKRFNFKHSIISNLNYIVDVHDYNDLADDCLNMKREIKSFYTKINFVNNNISYSEKISNVINELNKRSQVTIKNVYVSPIVQTFNLNGIVYVNNLVNKDLIKTKIYNKIYSWLDEKIDFGTEIYKSNIIELIENFSNVIRTDIKIEPELNLRLDRKSYFVSGLDSNYEIDYSLDQESKNRSVFWKSQSYGYGIENSYLIAKIFEEELRDFIVNHLSNSENFYNEFNRNTIWNSVISFNNLVFNNTVTERYFYSNFAKKIFERLKNEINNDYYQSFLFRDAISNIHRDLLLVIKNNMLDSNGNIAPEFSKIKVSNTEMKKLIRGGYSLGNEIIKMKVKLQVIYK